MSRLLHAAARKARIQRLMECPHRWENYQLVAPLRASDEDRIHPDDAHLAYGPISTALRDAAEQPKIFHRHSPSLPPYFAVVVEHKTEAEFRSLMASDELTHSLFYLILAECLADEGM